MQFPTVIGGVVPVVNIKGVPAWPVEADRRSAGQHYLGNIKKWNDAAHRGSEPWRGPA